MKAVLYYITLPFIYLVSLLPFKLMYLLSDVVYFVLYYIVGYRKKVVTTNLKNAFPEKSEAELKKITKQHYSYLCDLILETLKTLTIGRRGLEKCFEPCDFSIVEEYFKKDQSVIFVLGHYGNWELAGARFSLEPIHRLFVIYHPLSNKHFDKLVYHMRTRLGNGLYAMKNTLRGIVSNRREVTATAFIADQTPSPKNALWMDFLNQDTPVFMGTEKIASKFNYPVIYMSINRPRRGKYAINMQLVSDKPNELAEGELTKKYTQLLEKDIIEDPTIWLWTHRRWKHKRQ